MILLSMMVGLLGPTPTDVAVDAATHSPWFTITQTIIAGCGIFVVIGLFKLIPLIAKYVFGTNKRLWELEEARIRHSRRLETQEIFLEKEFPDRFRKWQDPNPDPDTHSRR